MKNNNITQSVEALENKAEKILEDAKKKAEDIFLHAGIEARNILISEPPADSIDTKCNEIIKEAKIEATKTKNDSNKHCDEIKANADKKIADVIDNIVSIITGANQG